MFGSANFSDNNGHSPEFVSSNQNIEMLNRQAGAVESILNRMKGVTKVTIDRPRRQPSKATGFVIKDHLGDRFTIQILRGKYGQRLLVACNDEFNTDAIDVLFAKGDLEEV